MNKNILLIAAAITLASSVNAAPASSNPPVYPYGVSQNYLITPPPAPPIYSAQGNKGQSVGLYQAGTSGPIPTKVIPTKTPTATGQQIANPNGTLSQTDLQTLARLSLQFNNELAPLGVRVSRAGSDELEEVDDIRSRAAGGNIALSGDFLVRHDDYLQNTNINGRRSGEATTGALRLKMEAAVNDHVSVVGRYVMYGDTYGSNFGGTTAGGTHFVDPITGNLLYKGHTQNRVDMAYIKINDLFKLGRDFYTHGSALVINDYADAVHVGHEINQWKLGLNVIYDSQDNGDRFADDLRHIWNFNVDYDAEISNLYLGFYTQDGKKNGMPAGALENRSYVELGINGHFWEESPWSFDVGFVTANTAVREEPSLSGMMFHGSIKYDTKNQWSLKLAYTAANDEYVSPLVMDYSQRIYEGRETPFDDIAYINGGKYSPSRNPRFDIGSGFTNSSLFKAQAEFIPNEHHLVRLAFDSFNKEAKPNGKIPILEDDSAGILTFEYKWEFYENCRYRFGYQTLSGNKASKDDKDDRMYMEVYSKF